MAHRRAAALYRDLARVADRWGDERRARQYSHRAWTHVSAAAMNELATSIRAGDESASLGFIDAL
jgi:hypothetical protein